MLTYDDVEYVACEPLQVHLQKQLTSNASRPRDANASTWRDITAMTSLSELSTDKAEEGALDLSGLCYGCLIPFKEALLKPNSRSRLLQLHDVLPHFDADPS